MANNSSSSSSSSSSDFDGVIISGMIGEEKTYFADNPVIITVSNLDFPQASPIKVVRVQVLHGGKVMGEFPGEAAGAAPYSITFDISSALRALWAEETFATEVAKATSALSGSTAYQYMRDAKPYSLKVLTEYIDPTDGEYTQTESPLYAGGSCVIGGRTEWERSLVTDDSKRDVSSLEKSNPRNGDASTKPRTTPELVGSQSITSWVDVGLNRNIFPNMPGTKSIFYPYTTQPAGDDSQPYQNWNGHAPIVIRDTVPYADFIFVNRRGAVETCSAQMLESLDIPVDTRQSTRIETPTYRPSRTIMATATGGRRSWSMSSGYQTREWAEWWTLEFLMARRHWMRYPLPGAAVSGASPSDSFVPVTVTPAKKTTGIYDRTKQEMPHVDFTVTLALEG